MICSIYFYVCNVHCTVYTVHALSPNLICDLPFKQQHHHHQHQKPSKQREREVKLYLIRRGCKPVANQTDHFRTAIECLTHRRPSDHFIWS